MYLLVTGAPRTGKTTFAGKLSARLNLPVIHTDDYLSSDWPVQLMKILVDIHDADFECIAEGTSAARLLRPNRVERLPDRVYLLRGPSEQLAPYKGLTTWILRYSADFKKSCPDRFVTKQLV